MIQSSNPPERNKGPNWRYVGTEPNGRWYAYSAGPPIGLDTHPSTLSRRPKTKPCLTKLTKGALSCPWCGVMREDWYAYVPLYRELDSRPVLVMVGRDQWQTVRRLDHLEPVIVIRGPEQSDGVVVRPVPHRPKFETADEAKRQPADISASLFTIWGIPDLTRWYMETGGRSAEQPRDHGQEQPREQPREQPIMSPEEELDLATRIIRRNLTVNSERGGEPGLIGDALGGALGRIGGGEPSPNGKHKRKPK